MVIPSTALAAALLTAGAHEGLEPRVVLEAPEYRAVTPLRLRAPLPEAEDDATRRAVFVEVTDFDARVHASAQRSTWGLGRLRRGTVLPAERQYPTEGCAGWASLPGGGGVCDGDGVRLRSAPSAPDAVTLDPDLHEDLPYRYAKVAGPGTPRLTRLPTADELPVLHAGEVPASLPHVRTEGVVFVALDRPYVVEHEAGDEVFVRTLEGDYVAQADLVPVQPPQTVGQPLIEATLPVAFVINDQAPVLARADDGTLVEQGVAQRTARFAVVAQTSVDGELYVQSDSESLVRRADVRLAEGRRPPSELAEGEKWIHVDLDEQVLVAYEGERPVFVTLIASGKAGFDTPTGSYRIRRKYISRRMMGPDPDSGTYDIAEVPWAMYYNGGYALHGAYWHDQFGQVRSHGCTNLPPEAARWLFHWVSPQIPDGWHARFEAGTYVLFTRG